MAIITDKKLIKSLMGKKSRANGKKFEVLVRKDLTEKGWNVCRWDNNVEITKEYKSTGKPKMISKKDNVEDWDMGQELIITEKCIPAKAKFNPFTKRVMNMSSGFPDFLAYKLKDKQHNIRYDEQNKCDEFLKLHNSIYFSMGCPFLNTGGAPDIIFIEVKTNGKLDKIEKQKAKWYLDNSFCSRFLIAKKVKVKNKIEVEYIDYT